MEVLVKEEKSHNDTIQKSLDRETSHADDTTTPASSGDDNKCVLYVAQFKRGSYWMGRATAKEGVWRVEFDNGEEDEWTSQVDVKKGQNLWQTLQDRQKRKRRVAEPTPAYPTTPTAAKDDEWGYSHESSSANAVTPVVVLTNFEYKQEKIAKYFGRKLHYGTILGCTEDDEEERQRLWNVQYEDGDMEDLDLSEVKEGIDLFKNGKQRKSLYTKKEPKVESISKNRKREKRNIHSPKVGDRVARYFGHEIYFGKIVGINLKKREWRVEYDDEDDDREYYYKLEEIQEYMGLYTHETDESSGRKRRRRKKNQDFRYKPESFSSGVNSVPTVSNIRADSDLTEEKTVSNTRVDEDRTKEKTKKSIAIPAAGGAAVSEEGEDVLSSFPYQNARVAKYFEKVLYYGTITECCCVSPSPTSSDTQEWLWHVSYEDGDTEDWDLAQLQLGLEVFRSRQKTGKGSSNTITTLDSTAVTKNISAHAHKFVDTDQGQYYEVDKVLDRRLKTMRNGIQVVQYFVKWKADEPNAWLYAEQLDQNTLAEAFRLFPNIAGDGKEEVDSKERDENISDFGDILVENENATHDDHEYDTDDDGCVLQLQDEIDVLAESKCDRNGSAEVVINRRAYRIGTYYLTNTQRILRITDILPQKQIAECVQYIDSKDTFLNPTIQSSYVGAGLYFQVGTKITVPLSVLKKQCSTNFAKSEWLYDYDPERKHSSFCYYKKNRQRVPPSVPGKSKPSVLELFAGAGGMSLGFKNAGMQTMWIVESNEYAAATLLANTGSSSVQIYTEDVRDFLEGCRNGNPAYPSKRGDVDHIHASPPCQGFSLANRVGGEEATENNNLTYEFVNAVRHFQPLTATYENVPGILRESTRSYIRKVVSDLQEMDYQVRVEILLSSDYGDPQNRKRVILWAAKSHMHLPSTPKVTHGNGPGLLPKKTVRDAIGGLEKYEAFVNKKGSINLNGVIDHNFRCIGTALTENDYVLRANRPARTMTGCAAVHYNCKRFLTVREAACIQSFPWNYQFFGGLGEQQKQVGNAVPVMMATQVARAVAKQYGLP